MKRDAKQRAESPFDAALKCAYRARPNRRVCRQVLESAEDTAATPEQYRFLAHAWWDLLQCEEKAVAALRRSTDIGEDDDWGIRCDLLIELLGPGARPHLVEVLREVSNLPSLDVLYDRIIMLACEAIGTPEAPILETDIDPFVEMLESRSEDHGDHNACALSWLYLNSDTHDVTDRIANCIRRMEQHAKSAYEWTTCAEMWGFIGPAYADDARRCLWPAEKLAEGELDRKIIASCVCSLPLTQQERVQGVKYLESKARFRDDWRECADYWLRSFRSTRNAKRCLRRARTSPPGRSSLAG